MNYTEMVWSLSERAYTAYWTDRLGLPLTPLKDQPEIIQKRWIAVVQAVARPVPTGPDTEEFQLKMAADFLNESLNRRS